MGGLYNVVFGMNPAALHILATLGLKPADIGRFRDCFVTQGRIAVYTRNGGGNREEYMPDFSDHPEYIEDKDDTFDSTYATIYFRLPAKHAELLRKFDIGPFDPDKRWKGALEAMKDPNYKPPPAVEKLAQQLKDALEGKGPNIISVGGE
jgi:hypothetical protein